LTEVDVDEFVFFDEFLGGSDVLLLHFGDVDFGVFDQEVFENGFLLCLLESLVFQFLNGVIGVDCDKP
jgi:hypothetical protein